jgi:hypothetical protein
VSFRTLLAASALLVACAPASAAADVLKLSDAEIGKVTANPDRSYPPQCLSYPLPTTVRGTPVVLTGVRLGDFDSNYIEQGLTITMWRVACSGAKSAVLVKIQRASNAPAATLPDVPIPFITQGTIVQRVGRLHFEPNTVGSEVNGHSIVGEVTLVLEDLPNAAARVNFSQAFTVEFGTALGTQNAFYRMDMPAYNAATHPDGQLALELSGHLSGSWYDPARGGEGMLVEVGERANGAKYAGFAWYTYDAQGRPTWILGSQDLPTTTVSRTVTIPALYIQGGGFAGNFNPTAIDAKAWGTVTLTFPSCNAMRLDYAAAATAPAGAPTGSGTRNWQRLVTLNGLTCE